MELVQVITVDAVRLDGVADGRRREFRFARRRLAVRSRHRQQLLHFAAAGRSRTAIGPLGRRAARQHARPRPGRRRRRGRAALGSARRLSTWPKPRGTWRPGSSFSRPADTGASACWGTAWERSRRFTTRLKAPAPAAPRRWPWSWPLRRRDSPTRTMRPASRASFFPRWPKSRRTSTPAVPTS